MDISKPFFQILNLIFNPLHHLKKFDGITVDRDYRYKKETLCTMDVLYKGEKYTKRSVYINVHGGGFVGGDKITREPFCQQMAEKGYFVVNINYRLADVNPFFASTEDVIDAVNFVPTLASIYNFDLDNIILSGDSAGAYLVMQTMICIGNDKYRERLSLPKVTTKISKQVYFCGPFDAITAMAETRFLNLNKSVVEHITNIKMDRKFKNLQNYAFLKETQLMNYIPKDNFVPIFISHSKYDYFCKGSGDAIIEILRDRGFVYDTHKAYRIIDNHCYHLMLYSKVSQVCLNKVDNFIKNN